MSKKIISLLAALSVGISGIGILPSGTFENFDIKADAITNTGGPCGDNVNWEYDGEGTLTFTGTGKMAEAKELYLLDTGWDGFRGVGEIKKVVIGEGITNIVDRAFSTCESLESVSIPNTVTKIGELAFNDCISLASVTIPDSVTTISARAFFLCAKLENITIPYTVTSIGNKAFGYGLSISSPDHAVKGITITGCNYTAAHKYAKENDFKFISLGNVPGDLNNSGTTDIDDLVIMQKVTAGWKVAHNKTASDLDGDKDTDVDDLVLMQKTVAGWKIK
ncbi:MAG: leucine-rich repeat domain-containing protein [Ruminococcus sp.]|nr:leucine-rich repeat domain-containing protein [Ruminococcus sp.]